MINQLLHARPVAVDRNTHRALRVRVPLTDWSVAARLNAVFVAAVEFGDAARDYPLVFINAGNGPDGEPEIAPVAVFALQKDDNLFVDGTLWRGAYVPAVLSAYPFGIARIDAERFAICFDEGWSGISRDGGDGGGEPLFDAAGEQTVFMKGVQSQLELLEGHVQRTRLMCRRLKELALLRDMRFDATLPDGGKLGVDGFLTVDADKLNALADDIVLELHRSGVLGLVHAHFVSLGNMRKLLDWHIHRAQAGTAAM